MMWWRRRIMEKKKKNSSLWCDDGYFEFNSINVQVRRYYDAYMMHRCLRIEINHYWIIYISIWTLLSHSSSFDILFLNTWHVRCCGTMEEAQELQYWTRRLERRVFLLAFCGSLAFLLGRFVSLGGDSQRILFNDIANILISVLQSQCVILMLRLMLPMWTKTFYRQGCWLFALSVIEV